MFSKGQVGMELRDWLGFVEYIAQVGYLSRVVLCHPAQAHNEAKGHSRYIMMFINSTVFPRICSSRWVMFTRLWCSVVCLEDQQLTVTSQRDC